VPFSSSQAPLANGEVALRSWFVGPHTHIAIVSTIRGATVNGFPWAPSHEVLGRAMTFGVFLPGRACTVSGNSAVWCGVARCPPPLEEARAIACRACSKGSQGKRG